MRHRLSGITSVCLLVLAGCTAEVTDQSGSAAGYVDDGGHHAVQFTSSSFQSEVLSNPQVVMVDAWAPWCGPCLQLGPTIEELAREYQGRAVIGKLNVDEAGDIASTYEIASIPALLFFKNGKEVDRIVGVVPKAEIAARLESLIGG